MLSRVLRYGRSAARVLLAFAVLGIALAAYTNVPTALTADDRRIFGGIGLAPLPATRTFDEEVSAIRSAQSKIFARAPLGEGILENQTREPADLMERVRHGLCYDRSRSLDKAFIFMGFESRHVYLLFTEGMSFGRAILTKGHPSHAVTEVKTSKGWMLVDSNSEWIALTKTGEPVDADHVPQRTAEFESAPEYMLKPFWSIKGLYSRKGTFYSKHVRFPELNWPDFFRSLGE